MKSTKSFGNRCCCCALWSYVYVYSNSSELNLPGMAIPLMSLLPVHVFIAKLLFVWNKLQSIFALRNSHPNFGMAAAARRNRIQWVRDPGRGREKERARGYKSSIGNNKKMLSKRRGKKKSFCFCLFRFEFCHFVRNKLCFRATEHTANVVC